MMGPETNDETPRFAAIVALTAVDFRERPLQRSSPFQSAERASMKTLTVSVVALFAIALAACGGEARPEPASPTVEPTPEPPAEPAPKAPKAPKLALEVITGSPEGFLVNSALVTGEKDAVLIDAQFTLADGKKVVDAVKASGKHLTTVYVTHWHPDHYFGFVALKEAFPDAKLVALPTTVTEIQQTWESKVKQWQPLYKDAITAHPIIPEPLAGDAIDLEGEKLEVVGGQQGDASNNSYVWIAALSTLVAGDLVYDQVYPWTAETNAESRQAWGSTLEKLEALSPKLVVPGHQKPEQKQQATNIEFTKDYLKAYDEALASSKTATDLQSKVKKIYPDTALDIVLQIGAEASLPPKGAKKKKGT
jgi:glyoxylase-like metal-dependent hydrolase (beta-lactamase superfamily II)